MCFMGFSVGKASERSGNVFVIVGAGLQVPISPLVKRLQGSGGFKAE